MTLSSGSLASQGEEEHPELSRPRPTEKYWEDYEDWKVSADERNAAASRPARDDIDVDVVGAGIEAVLDEFLDDRGRPLDNLAGSDLIDQVTW